MAVWANFFETVITLGRSSIWQTKYFGLDTDSCLKNEEFNQQQHFLIVTNKLDQKNVEAISYWKKNGLNIDGIIYWVVEINGGHFIESNMYSPIERDLD